MSAAAASPLQFEFDGFPSEPSLGQGGESSASIPGALKRRLHAEESRRLFRRTLCASLGIHSLVLIAGWFFINTYFPPQAELLIPPQSPELFDISIVPLSALETILPSGAPVESSSQAPEMPKNEPAPEPVKEKPQPPEVVAPKKKVESPKPIKQKPEQKTTSSAPSTTSAPAAIPNAQSSHQQPGFVNGTGPSNEKARLNYQEAIASLLARAKRYPERALRRGMTGEGTIRIEIRSDGSLAEFEILRSAGASILDDELRAMVDRASPFPSFPGDLKRDSLALVVPVAFTIK